MRLLRWRRGAVHLGVGYSSNELFNFRSGVNEPKPVEVPTTILNVTADSELERYTADVEDTVIDSDAVRDWPVAEAYDG